MSDPYFPGQTPEPCGRHAGRVSRFLAFPVAAAVLLVLAGCSGGAASAQSTPTVKTVTAAGTMTVTGYGNISWGDAGASDGAPCQGSGPFSDMTPGAAVVVTDPQGKTIGTGALEQGTDPNGGSSDFTCVMDFHVPDLPAGVKRYGFHVGNASRGVLEFTPDQIGMVSLTLGG